MWPEVGPLRKIHDPVLECDHIGLGRTPYTCRLPCPPRFHAVRPGGSVPSKGVFFQAKARGTVSI